MVAFAILRFVAAGDFARETLTLSAALCPQMEISPKGLSGIFSAGSKAHGTVTLAFDNAAAHASGKLTDPMELQTVTLNIVIRLWAKLFAVYVLL